MPTSPRGKIHRIIKVFRRIRNILHRADVGIGPYNYFFDSLKLI